MSGQTNQWSVRVAVLLMCAVVAMAGATHANGGNGNGNGGGGGGGGNNDKGGGKGGGDITPARITFIDEMGFLGNRISGDGLGAYTHDEASVDAFIGTGGAEGDIFLWLSGSSRGLWLDFSDCLPDPTACDPPFAASVNSASSIAVAPGDVISGGLYGMAEGWENRIEAPMEINYDFSGPDGPGFIYFDRDLKSRKNPCRNQSLFVTVERTGPDTWVVSANDTILACATKPDDSLSGQYRMPFEFEIERLATP